MTSVSSRVITHQASHQGHVRNSIQGAQLREGEGGVKVVDGHVGQSAKLAVDASHDLVHH